MNEQSQIHDAIERYQRRAYPPWTCLGNPEAEARPGRPAQVRADGASQVADRSAPGR
jgi:hypothetical protein